MKLRTYMVLLGIVLCVTGCDSSSSDETSTDDSSTTTEETTTEETSSTDETVSAAVLSAFNLSDISASDDDVKTMTLTWDTASEETGVTYTVCEEVDDECNELTSVTDTLTATVTVDSLVTALSTNYYIVASNSDDETVSSNEEALTSDTVSQMIGYFKASNTGAYDYFGVSVALCDDGSTLAVGAYNEDGDTTGVLTSTDSLSDDGDESDDFGAVYLFSYDSGRWAQIAYVKASNAGEDDEFGRNVVLSGDGTTLAVGAYKEDGDTTGVLTSTDSLSDDGDDSDDFGAVYLFSNESGSWEQSAYVKASNAGAGDYFGASVALSNDGTTLAVGAYKEDGETTGVLTSTDGLITDDGSADYSGAVYLFSNSTGSWVQSAYIKASNAGEGDRFGSSVALSSDGATLAVTANYEDGSDTSVITTTTDIETASGADGASNSGAAYLFSNSAGTWVQSAYVKASNSSSSAYFGSGITLSGDGTILVVGDANENEMATGVITDSALISNASELSDSGAVYLFSNSSGSWAQSTYIKASNTGEGDRFGYSVALSTDGATLAVGARDEGGSDTGVITDSSLLSGTDGATDSGAVYLFSNSSGSWAQSAYVKASNAAEGDKFGISVALDSNGSTLAVGAYNEDNSATGIITDGSEIDGDLDGTSTFGSGAVYIY